MYDLTSALAILCRFLDPDPFSIPQMARRLLRYLCCLLPSKKETISVQEVSPIAPAEPKIDIPSETLVNQ
jgi:hypothetical protein